MDALECLEYFGFIKEKRHLIANIKFGCFSFSQDSGCFLTMFAQVGL